MTTATASKVHSIALSLDYTETDFDGLLDECNKQGLLITEDELFELSETDSLVSMFLDR